MKNVLDELDSLLLKPLSGKFKNIVKGNVSFQTFIHLFILYLILKSCK